MNIYLIVLLFLLAIFLIKQCKKPSKFPPGPRWWPILGNLPLIKQKLSDIGYHHLVWEEMVKTYGPIVGLKLGGKKVILVSEKSTIKEVSSRQGFEGRPDGFYWRQRANGGRYGLVFAEGPEWEEQKKFSLVHLKRLGFGNSFMEDLILAEALKVVMFLKRSYGTPINISRVFTIPVLNVLWSFVAGKTYDYDDAKLNKVCNAINKSFRVMDSSGGILEYLPFLRHISDTATGYRDFVENQKEMMDFIKETIKEHKKNYNEAAMKDYIDTYLCEMNKSKNVKSSFSEEQLSLICLDLLQAGSDTTSNTLEFLIYFLCKHQDVQRKLQSEIDDVIGRFGKPTYNDKQKMPYTTAVILEVQRLANIAPAGVPHRALDNLQLDKYIIPKDSVVLLLYYNIHMHEKWDDPNAFRPDRFLDANKGIINTDAFAPFGFGKRKCMGELLAKMTLFLFCVNLFQNFNCALTDPEKRIKITNGISLSPEPFNVYFTYRS